MHCSFKAEELQQQVAAARAQGADLVLVFIHWCACPSLSTVQLCSHSHTTIYFEHQMHAQLKQAKLNTPMYVTNSI
jgi:hypothetical protein